MIKNYDPNIRYGIHTVRVTFMQWNYVGHIAFKIRGNMKGADVLEAAIDRVYPETLDTLVENDCSLCWDDEMEVFRGYLTNPDGEQLEIEEDPEELDQLVVCVEIVDFEEDI